MSKSFDSLHHALMNQKLKTYGFSDTSLELVRSFFNQRKNRVKLNGMHSSWKEQTRGCPQGSSLGPLLWNLFQNDLPLHTQSANLFMYADDHQIYTQGGNIHQVTNLLKCEAQEVSNWYKDNLLEANAKKYQILAIESRTKTTSNSNAITLEIEGREITSTENLKILGVNIDDKLEFCDHIDICKKVSQKIGIFSRLRNMALLQSIG